MDVLKKIKASSLVETLAASVLIMIVFMIANLSFTSILTNQRHSKTAVVENRIRELEYLVYHHQLPLPYEEDFMETFITITYKNGQAELTYTLENTNYHKRILYEKPE